MPIVMSQQPRPAKRKRGILLSPKGWHRLQVAEQQSLEREGSQSKGYTLQELSDLTGLSANTLARVRGRKIAVDQQTLEAYFRAFELNLMPEDYADSDAVSFLGKYQVPPSGQLPLESRFYVERAPIETLCLDGVSQPGGLIRIKAPRLSGKTSLAARTLMQARDRGLATVILSLRLADSQTFSNLQRFLQWFCAVISQNLGLPNELESHWDNLFGASYNCTHYFETYLLKHLESPIVLALDEVDTVFDYPEIATDFFGMLRAWYEKSRYGDSSSELWQKLRLILVHSTEVYVPLNVAQSPFNAGLLVELPGFNQSQTEELAKSYGLEQSVTCAKQLMQLVGGRPHLVHLGLYHLSASGMTMEDLLNSALDSSSIYSSHLRNQLWELQKYPDLLQSLKQVVNAEKPIDLPPLQSYKLQSKGLVAVSQQKVSPSCDLYRSFFQQALANFPG
jgi:transcriptional regulator with XRE-family HTH domain